MRLIAVDLELNQPSGKIIQIGAVCYNSTGELVNTGIFNTFVDPKESIDPFITTLTKITDDDVKNSPNILEAAQLFSRFKNDLKASPIGITWGGAGSKSNDIRKIFEEAGIENPFKPRIIDIKCVYQMFANSSSQKFKSKVGLETACNLMKIGWDSVYGEPHNALADAYNTMRLYMFFSKCLKGGIEIKLG